jgi:uncharacterized protein (DUF952 family)
MTRTAFKVFTAEQWAQFEASGTFHGAPVDIADGYIHLSTSDQLAETIAKHFAGQSELMVAEIDLEPYGDNIRWEVSRGAALFPHLYGTLAISTVQCATPTHG